MNALTRSRVTTRPLTSPISADTAMTAAIPKAGVFAVSFLPQFVPAGWSVPVMLVVFSVLWALIDLVWYAAMVWLVGAARRVLGRAGVRRRLEQVSGVVLVGLGVRLAAAAR